MNLENLFFTWEGGIIACPCGRTYQQPSELGDFSDSSLDWLTSPQLPEKLLTMAPLGECCCGRVLFQFQLTNRECAPPTDTFQKRFSEFHAAHPEVYEYLVRISYDLKARGKVRYGNAAVWERMRWHFSVDTDPGEEFKLNNNYRSRYIRMLLQDHPDLQGLYELRRLRVE